MRINVNHIWLRLLKLLRLSPLSLAEKCRVAFGAAVVFVLILALLWPYIWMGQLTKKTYLDAGRVKAETILRQHFQLNKPGEKALTALANNGDVLDVNDPEIRMVRFTKDGEAKMPQLTEEQKEMVESLKSEQTREDNIFFAKKAGILYSNYVRIFRANDKCINCHKPQGSGSPFSPNEQIAAVVFVRVFFEEQLNLAQSADDLLLIRKHMGCVEHKLIVVHASETRRIRAGERTGQSAAHRLTYGRSLRPRYLSRLTRSCHRRSYERVAYRSTGT